MVKVRFYYVDFILIVFKGSVRQKYKELAKSEFNPEWIATSFFAICNSKNERINLKLFAVIPFGGS